ncbi:MAG: hypothetical protein VZQ84_00695 [Anaerovoracaceae bacterium]|nr:hypothetical protein [Anaerovoracaceae bacterium]
MKRFIGRFGTYITIDGEDVTFNSLPANKESCSIDDIKSVSIWEAAGRTPGRMTILTGSTRHNMEFESAQNDDFVECYRLLIAKIDPYMARTYRSPRK